MTFSTTTRSDPVASARDELSRRRTLSLCVALCVGTLAWLIASPGAWADSSREQARALVRRANTSFRQGDYNRALELFQQAQRLYPSHRISYNVGVTLEKLDWPIRAAEHYERFLDRMKSDNDLKKAAKAEQRLARLQKKLGRLTLNCRQAGVQVQVGEGMVGTTPLGRTIYLRPGKFRVLLTREGFHPRSLTVTLAAGGWEKLAVDGLVPLSPEPAAEPSGSSGSPATAAGAEPVTVADPTRRSRPATQPDGPAVTAEPFVQPPKQLEKNKEKSPLYKKWWFWTAVAGAAAAVSLGVTLPLMLSRPDMERYDPHYSWTLSR